MRLINRANRPPKAPAAVAAEKKRAIRKLISYRLYHWVRKKLTPGNRPGSQSLDAAHIFELTSLCNTEENSRNKKAYKVLNKAHGDHDASEVCQHLLIPPVSQADSPPSDHDDRQPHGGPPSLHDHVGRYLEYDIEGEEDSEACGVLGRRKSEIFRETEKVGVTDICSIQEGQEVEEG